MLTLRSLTDSHRRTLILSIHQPSSKILSTIDRLLLLRRGSVLLHGPTSSLLSNGFSLPPHLNPLEFAIEILPNLQPQPHQQAQSLEITPSPPPIEPKTRSRSSRIHEITILYYRFWKLLNQKQQPPPEQQSMEITEPKTRSRS